MSLILLRKAFIKSPHPWPRLLRVVAINGGEKTGNFVVLRVFAAGKYRQTTKFPDIPPSLGRGEKGNGIDLDEKIYLYEVKM